MRETLLSSSTITHLIDFMGSRVLFDRVSSGASPHGCA
jgi:hypothetical protein